MYHSRVMFEDSGYLDRYFHTCDGDSPLVVQVFVQGRVEL